MELQLIRAAGQKSRGETEVAGPIPAGYVPSRESLEAFLFDGEKPEDFMLPARAASPPKCVSPTIENASYLKFPLEDTSPDELLYPNLSNQPMKIVVPDVASRVWIQHQSDFDKNAIYMWQHLLTQKMS